MDRLVVQTSLGPLPLVGRLHTGAARPSLLVIGGAFPPPDYMHDLVDRYPGANVLVGALPGMGTPSFARQDSSDYARAFDEALEMLLPSQPIVAYGISTGCLVTLGLQRANVRRHVLEEPFFSTRDLWSFIEYARDRMVKNPDKGVLKDFFWEIFGIRPDTVDDRDYWPLLERLRAPADAIVGEMPLLPRRDLPTWPSFTTTEDRLRMQQNPLVTLHVAPSASGHNLAISREARDLVDRVRLSALKRVATAQDDGDPGPLRSS